MLIQQGLIIFMVWYVICWMMGLNKSMFIIIIIKMLASIREELGDELLSPKETQERIERQLKLVKIDQDITSIINLNHKQHAEYKSFIIKLQQTQSDYARENRELKQKIKEMSVRYGHLTQMYEITKEELEKALTCLQGFQMKRGGQQKEMCKLKQMIKNQEQLFDQYRKNLQEEFQLERQFMKSTFNQEKIKIQKEFNHTVLKLQSQYNEKLKKMVNKKKLEDIREEFGDFQKYCNVHKQNVMKKSQSSSQKPHSQYSTNDREQKHNQPVFMA